MLIASFAKPVGMFDNFFNKAVAWATNGEFCHSEFIFTYTKEEFENMIKEIEGHTFLKEKFSNYVENNKINLCFYVIWGDRVSYRLLKHTHNNPFYRMPNSSQFKTLKINVTMEQEEKLMSFLLNQCGKSYDYNAALAYWVPWRRSMPEYSKYFCSQLMLTSLHQIQMFREHNPASTTPNQLYKILK